MIRFENVGLRYDMGPEVLRDLSFEIRRQSFQFLTGPSGAGKTSLLRMLFLALRPTRNPFKAATIVREPGVEAGAPGEWSCSSIFLYAVHGRRDDAPPLPQKGELEKMLGPLAQQLRETQTPSPVP